MAVAVPTYFVDFKIVPVCNIHGAVGKIEEMSTYYITPDVEESKEK